MAVFHSDSKGDGASHTHALLLGYQKSRGLLYTQICVYICIYIYLYMCIHILDTESQVAYSTFNTTQPTWSRRGAADLLHMRPSCKLRRTLRV